LVVGSWEAASISSSLVLSAISVSKRESSSVLSESSDSASLPTSVS
jgi:hypothetical protein